MVGTSGSQGPGWVQWWVCFCLGVLTACFSKLSVQRRLNKHTASTKLVGAGEKSSRYTAIDV